MIATVRLPEKRRPAGALAALRQSNRGRIAVMIARLSILLSVLPACHHVETGGDGGASSQPPVEVRVAVAESRTLRPVLDLVGTVVAIPEQTAVVSPQLGGWITRVAVVEGQKVEAREVLVEFDSRAAKLALQRATAVVHEKQATFERLKRGPLPEEIDQARQLARQAKANVAALQNELAALRVLLERKEISEVVYANKSQALEGAVAAAAAAEERVKLLEAGTRPELVEEARGLLEAAQADLARAQLELQWCTVASPIDGIVTQLVARKGQFFDAAQPLATVVDLATVFVQLRIPGDQSAKVGVGTPVTARLAVLPDHEFQGTVARMASQADPATGNVIAFARIRNEGPTLRIGQNCLARVSLPEVPAAVAVPVAAVADNDGQPVVTVVRNSQAFETPVETGIEANGFVQITKGLSAGDRVATWGGYGLPAGCPVKVVDAPAHAP